MEHDTETPAGLCWHCKAQLLADEIEGIYCTDCAQAAERCPTCHPASSSVEFKITD